MSEMLFPQEYQTQIDAATRKRKLAELMMQTALQSDPKGGMVGKHYVGAGPMQYLAKALQQGMGSSGVVAADTDISRIKQEANAAETSELGGILGKLKSQVVDRGEQMGPATPEGGQMPHTTETLPPDWMGAEQAALGAKFGSNRKLAEALTKQRLKLFETAAATSSGPSVQQAVMAGGDPTALKPNTWEVPKETPLGNGGTAVTMQDQRGGARLSTVGAPSSTTVNTGNKAGLEAMNDATGDFRKRADVARKTAGSLPDLLQAASILEKGNVLFGTGTEAIMAAKGLAPHFGLDPNLADTETVRAAAIKQIGEIIKMFGAGTGLSNSDREMAQAAAADPTKIKDGETLKRLLHGAIRGAVKGTETFNKEGAELEQGWKNAPFGEGGKPYGWAPPIPRAEWKMGGQYSPEQQALFERLLTQDPNYGAPAVPGSPPPMPPRNPGARRGSVPLAPAPMPPGAAPQRPGVGPDGAPVGNRVSPAVLQQWLTDPKLSPEERAWVVQELNRSGGMNVRPPVQLR